MHRTRWPDLLPELLHKISGLLHDASDFVRFHAVCRLWRGSQEPTSKKTTDQFLPWLVTPNNKEDDESLNLRCVFSKTGYLAPPLRPLRPGGTTGGRHWVSSTDGTAVCYLNANNSPYGPALHDAATGAALAYLPPLFLDKQWEEEDNPSGTIYEDGTVLLYSKHDSDNESETKFRAALLRPGDDVWTVVDRTLDLPGLYYAEFCAAYHGGKILVTVERSRWHVVATTTTTGSDEDAMVVSPPSMPLDDHDGILYEYTHVIQSRGELLWASVHIAADYPQNYKKGVCGLVRALSVRVHALEEEATTSRNRRRRWVSKKGASLADRVLFLGWPNSLAVDASRVGMTAAGGFAYFVYEDDKGSSSSIHPPRCGVFRHNLVGGTTELVEWLAEGCDAEACTWLIPQPTIAPMTSRCPATTTSTAAPSSRGNNGMIGRIERRYSPWFRVLVRNLPLSANSTQLRHLFSKHGIRVSDAEIVCYKKTKRSQGIGLVTMSTVHDHPGDVLPALNGLVFEGCALQVGLIKEGRPR